MVDVAADTIPKTDPTSTAIWSLVIVQVSMLITLILGYIWQAWKTNKREKWQVQLRKWELEDREALAKKVEDTAAKLSEQTKHDTELLWEQQHGHTRRIEEKLEKNLEIAQATKDAAGKAYDAANNFAVKLDKMNMQKEDKK